MTAAFPLLDRLRDETRGAHEALEHALDWQRRMATADGYRHVLERLYGWHVVWEDAAGRALADAAFFDPRRRAPLLAADLRSLGLDDAAIAALPPCPDAAPDSRAALLGGLYVMEGSTLGGQVVARHVSAALGLVAGAGCRYYAGHGASTGAMWREARAWLATQGADAGGADALVPAARRVFDRLRAWLTIPGHP